MLLLQSRRFSLLPLIGGAWLTWKTEEWRDKEGEISSLMGKETALSLSLGEWDEIRGFSTQKRERATSNFIELLKLFFLFRFPLRRALRKRDGKRWDFFRRRNLFGHKSCRAESLPRFGFARRGKARGQRSFNESSVCRGMTVSCAFGEVFTFYLHSFCFFVFAIFLTIFRSFIPSTMCFFWVCASATPRTVFIMEA